ncbi:hypothetical protein M231_03458 [Tremella mesenterica]|uniref:Uncharacterized protein n=1 Tax=Tremella mesenterica TaxID=5217 RepID=A0A4Q1BN12_TREME|nr:hypothetical protein M231_03458 [Tremella mesenterica]
MSQGQDRTRSTWRAEASNLSTSSHWQALNVTSNGGRIGSNEPHFANRYPPRTTYPNSGKGYHPSQAIPAQDQFFLSKPDPDRNPQLEDSTKPCTSLPSVPYKVKPDTQIDWTAQPSQSTTNNPYEEFRLHQDLQPLAPMYPPGLENPTTYVPLQNEEDDMMIRDSPQTKEPITTSSSYNWDDDQSKIKTETTRVSPKLQVPGQSPEESMFTAGPEEEDLVHVDDKWLMSLDPRVDITHQSWVADGVPDISRTGWFY